MSTSQFAEVLEKEFSAQVYEVAKMTGWRRYHTYRSKRSPKGFPDEVLCRERVVFLEIKREKTQTTSEQKDWILALHRAGAEVYVVRPRNLQDLALVLTTRDMDWEPGSKAWSARHRLREETWQEIKEQSAA